MDLCFHHIVEKLINEQQGQEMYLRICASSVHSDQPVRSLLCAFWICKDVEFLQANKEDCTHCMDVQAVLSLYWVHLSEGTFSQVGE